MHRFFQHSSLYVVDVFSFIYQQNCSLEFFLAVSDLFIALYDVIYLWCKVKRLRCALTRGRETEDTEDSLPTLTLSHS